MSKRKKRSDAGVPRGPREREYRERSDAGVPRGPLARPRKKSRKPRKQRSDAGGSHVMVNPRKPHRPYRFSGKPRKQWGERGRNCTAADYTERQRVKTMGEVAMERVLGE